MSRKRPSPFARSQRERQARWRGELSPGQWRLDGGRVVPLRWGLPVDQGWRSLYPPIADDLLRTFAADDIAWHDETQDRYGDRYRPGPSPNLMDSQVFCLNFWQALADLGADFLLPAVQQLVPEAVTVEAPRQRLLEPEWIGLDNPLGEPGRRRRGQYATSADLLLGWRDASGRRHGLLVESKWSEAYDDSDLRWSRRGTDRAATYRPSWSAAWSPLLPAVAPESFMVDPFDQLLRLQLLAAAMQNAGELGFVRVLVGWVAPAANTDLWTSVTAASLRGRGDSVPACWRSLLRDADSFRAASYEQLFTAAQAPPRTDTWAAWMAARYGLEQL